MKSSIRSTAVRCLVLLSPGLASFSLQAQEAEIRVETAEPAPPVATPDPAPSLKPEEASAVLRENLEETIREGEKVLRDLPHARIRVVRSRLANLERQVERKDRERKELQGSLALLRADFYRRLAAIRRNNGRIEANVLAEREKRLRDDYDLHAESFEEELKALDEDIVAIEKTIEELRAQAMIDESLKPALRPDAEETRPQASDRLLEIPRQLNPFELRSVVPMVRGRTTAPAEVLWGLRGEIAFHLGDADRAERFWLAVHEAPGPDEELRGDARYNLAYLAYTRGDFVTSYQIFFTHADGNDLEALTGQEAYTLAVLAYLNGLVGDSRRYLEYADPAHQKRMEDVVGIRLASNL